MLKEKWHLILLFITITFTIIACDTTEPKLTTYHNKILYTSLSNTKPQLYMMNTDGSGVQQITNDQYWHSEGRWSPNADKIVCNTYENSSTAGNEMVIMNPDGSNKVFLGYGNQMAWSPDGKQIAFVYFPSAEWGSMYQFIYVINADGTNLKQITSDSLEVINSPCWSKDGSKIYFASNRYDVSKNYPEIYYMNNNGANVTRVTFTQKGFSVSPSISPAGDKIAFLSTMNNASAASIYISDLNGNNKILIATPPNNEVYNFPRWSPDGQSILFAALTGSAKIFIYKVNIDGTNLIKLADNATSPDWSK